MERRHGRGEFALLLALVRVMDAAAGKREVTTDGPPVSDRSMSPECSMRSSADDQSARGALDWRSSVGVGIIIERLNANIPTSGTGRQRPSLYLGAC